MIRLLHKAANVKCNINSLVTRCMSGAAPSSALPSPQTNPEILYHGVSFTMSVNPRFIFYVFYAMLLTVFRSL